MIWSKKFWRFEKQITLSEKNITLTTTVQCPKRRPEQGQGDLLSKKSHEGLVMNRVRLTGKLTLTAFCKLNL